MSCLLFFLSSSLFSSLVFSSLVLYYLVLPILVFAHLVSSALLFLFPFHKSSRVRFLFFFFSSSYSISIPLSLPLHTHHSHPNPGTTKGSIRNRISALRVKQRDHYEKLGWKLPDGGAVHSAKKTKGGKRNALDSDNADSKPNSKSNNANYFNPNKFSNKFTAVNDYDDDDDHAIETDTPSKKKPRLSKANGAGKKAPTRRAPAKKKGGNAGASADESEAGYADVSGHFDDVLVKAEAANADGDADADEDFRFKMEVDEDDFIV